jgi:hypothetical protein
MRNWIFLAALFTPLAMAEAVLEVAANSLMRLPSSGAVLHLQRLHIAERGTLMIPAGVSEIRIDELRLGAEARIAVAPGEQPLQLLVGRAEAASGAQINARGARGMGQQPAQAGRPLTLRLHTLAAETLQVDARGGPGAPGYAGLDGADGEAGGCTWGQASRGHDGLDGGDGQAGAPGARVRVELPLDFPTELLQIRLEGGEGGAAGLGGKGGRGGLSKGCLLYSTDGAADGRPGQPGKAGEPGQAGLLEVVRF